MKTKVLIYLLLIVISACTYSVDDQNSDEYKLQQLTGSIVGVENPSFSPNGNQVYYIENTGFNQYSLNRIDIDGRNNTTVFSRDRIRNYIVADDNSSIIFDNVYEYPDSSGIEILMTNYFGDGFTRLLDRNDSLSFLDIYPVDVNMTDSLLLLDILVEDNGGIVNSVYTLDILSGKLTKISGDFNAYASSFSPDKSRILFASEQGDSRFTINTADTSGNNVLSIYEVDQKIELAGYSQNGFKILFGAPPTPDSTETLQIYSIASDGTNLVRITDNHVNNIPAGYSNDESFVLFHSQRYVDNPDDYDVYIYDEVFGTEYLIMDNNGNDFGVSFSPTELRLLILSDAPGLPNLFIYDFTHMYR